MYQRSLFYPDMKWENEYHALFLRWEDFSPVLLCRCLHGNESLKEYPLIGRIEIYVFNEKTCIGRWEDDRYVPCPNAMKVVRFQRCDACAGKIIPDQSCIFEPKCPGDSCLVEDRTGERIEFCARPHVVYVAFYGTTPKVGLTSRERIRKRCIEQGADAYAVITRCDNRFEARQKEMIISRTLPIRQSLSSGEILRMTTSPVEYDRIQEVFERMIGRMKYITGMELEDLNILKSYPISLPLRSVPRETTTPGPHIGRTVGLKGRFLYYEAGGLTALNISDIPSRRILVNKFH